MSRKPQRGVCGHCGRAVPPQRWADGSVKLVGHEFADGRLVRVRCFDCAELNDWSLIRRERPGNP